MRRWQVANFPASLFPAPMRSLPLKVYTSTVRHGWSSKEATDDSVGAGGSHGHPALRCLPAVSDTGEGAGTDPWGIPVGSALCGRESSGHVLVIAVSSAGHGRVWVLWVQLHGVVVLFGGLPGGRGLDLCLGEMGSAAVLEFLV